MSRRHTITPAMRVYYKMKKKVIREVFREAFYKYIQGGRGTNLGWTYHFGNDGRKHVLKRLRVILSWVSNDDVYILSERELFERLKKQYRFLVHHYKGADYDEYIMWKYGEVDL